MAMTTVTGGPVLTPAQVHALVVQPLIDQSVAAQVSTVIQTSSHDLKVPIVTVDPAASFVAEGSEIPATDPTLTEMTASVKKLGRLDSVVKRARERLQVRPRCRWSAMAWYVTFGESWMLLTSGTPPRTAPTAWAA